MRRTEPSVASDNGSIFRYAPHENSITYYKVSSGKSEVTIAGERDMIDLLDGMSMVFIWEYFMEVTN